MSEQIDVRVEKSKSELKKALLMLLKTNAFERISVMQICNEAGITRATFYKYYDDKYELLYAIILDMRKSISIKYHSLIDSKATTENPTACLKEIIDMLIDLCIENKELLINLYSDQDNAIVECILKTALDKFVTHVIELYSRKAALRFPIELTSAMFVGGFANLTLEWIKNSDKYSRETLANMALDVLGIVCERDAIFVDSTIFDEK